MCRQERLKAGPLGAFQEAVEGLVGLADVVVDVQEHLGPDLTEADRRRGRDHHPIADASHLDQDLAQVEALQEATP
jgi:hypothetical protein